MRIFKVLLRVRVLAVRYSCPMEFTHWSIVHSGWIHTKCKWFILCKDSYQFKKTIRQLITREQGLPPGQDMNAPKIWLPCHRRCYDCTVLRFTTVFQAVIVWVFTAKPNCCLRSILFNRSSRILRQVNTNENGWLRHSMSVRKDLKADCMRNSFWLRRT